MTPPTVVHETFAIERTYDVPVASVFRAWTDPAVKARWFAGSSDALGAGYELDFRVGGRDTAEGAFHDGPVSRYGATRDAMTRAGRRRAVTHARRRPVTGGPRNPMGECLGRLRHTGWEMSCADLEQMGARTGGFGLRFPSWPPHARTRASRCRSCCQRSRSRRTSGWASPASTCFDRGASQWSWRT